MGFTPKLQVVSRIISLICVAAVVNADNYKNLRHPSMPKILVSNDDGWASANIRAVKAALDDAGYNTILSAPANDRSGTGSSSTFPVPLTTSCEFNTCPPGSPAEGFNASDPSLNYVNAFPADSVRFGIRTLVPQFFDARRPDLVVSGPNEGQNLGNITLISGTVGAATEAAACWLVPAIAFSGVGPHTPYTDRRPGDTAEIFGAASLRVVQQLTKYQKSYLPPQIALNVNFPDSALCKDKIFEFVLTRINAADPGEKDVFHCSSHHLPLEEMIMANATRCRSSISVYRGPEKMDVDIATQTFVLKRLLPILSCP